MKYFAKCWLLLAIICLIGQTLLAQRRDVVFFYGLNKKATESSAYANYFESTRQITSHWDAFNYVTQQADPLGMQKVSEDARVQAAASLGTNVNNSRNVALGHDIGGLIARKINNTNPNMFGGIILTGTPNTDMPIVTNFINGRIHDEFRITGIARAPDVKIPFKLGAQDFGTISIADIPLKWAEKFFGADPASVFKSVTDLQRDSRFLRNLGNPTIPTVTIWGNEDDPAIWRFFSSVNGAAIGATTLGSVAEKDAIAALVLSSINTATNTIQTEQLWATLKIVGATAALFTGFYALEGTVLTQLFKAIGLSTGAGLGIAGAMTNFGNAAKARKTRDWLESSGTIWKNLIGATRTEQVNVGVQGAMRENCRQMVNDPNQGWAAYWTVLTPQQRLDCWINETILQTIQVQEESDGVLHKTTQEFRSALADDHIFEARGSNHEELLNHTAVTQVYDRKVWGNRQLAAFFTE